MNLRRGLVFFILVSCLFGRSPIHAQNNTCESGEAPDLIIGDIPDKTRYGVIGDITAFAIGNATCNQGTCQGNWIATTPEHPIFAQNMFRLKGGRMEQIGQAWAKHGFTALQQTLCSSSCLSSGTGNALGVNCSDPYSSSLNGAQARLGPKFEVNPNTGVFPYPATDGSATGDTIYKRLQIHNADLDPALNPGAQYFVEVQVVAHDDSLGRNHNNNASYRPVTITGSAGTWDFSFAGPTVRQKAAIEAWDTADPTVVKTNALDPDKGRVIVSAKVTSLGGSLWHYEYAVQNLSSDRSVRLFSVPIPAGAVVTNAGFHDVDYHSGEPFDGTDWVGMVNATSVTWATARWIDDQNANALRWGTLYNFRFDVNVAPVTSDVTLGLFRPGTPTSLTASTLTPEVCNRNGVCDPGETCSSCAFDCANQGGGSGCCGDGTCEAGESPCRCPADCGSVSQFELLCNNGIDEDCDGLTDCADFDCCTDAACSGSDLDFDGYAVCDCNDQNGGVWATPGEALDLRIAKGVAHAAVLSWQWPVKPGGSVFAYDALRSASPVDFTAASCLSVPVPSVPSCSDASDPAPGTLFFYLVRMTNACPSGVGPLGAGSNGVLRTGRTCP